MADLHYSDSVKELFNGMMALCERNRHEFATPEHLLYQLLGQDDFAMSLTIFAEFAEVYHAVMEQLGQMERVPDNVDYKPEISAQLSQLMANACGQVVNSSAVEVEIPHLVKAMLDLENSWASYILKRSLGDDVQNFLVELISNCEASGLPEYDDDDDAADEDGEEDGEHRRDPMSWRRLVTCINDQLEQHHPLIGRANELQRTIQVLCRKEKNNPLHVGEPGVGKTALVYGLAAMIEKGDVPERLKGCKIYQLDLGTMLAGTQFRGDFEKRMKLVMDGVRKEGNVIVYIDEIHNLVGAGRTGEGSMDASNMLKPYLEGGDIRFIGSTTYDEYNRYFSKSKGIVRRFQQIDIAEPSVADTIAILKGLQPSFEAFHHVKYTDEAIDFAVTASAQHMSERFLPDKAIDLIDEAGAWLEMQSEADNQQSGDNAEQRVVGKQAISEVLQKICKIDAAALTEDSNEQLETLQKRILDRIYGQDEAVRQVVESVQMSKAGLLDEGKPLASLLFVGPTGVGKTEVARVLAQELGIQLVRFDMSEYTEKHTVAKLIGSPAGYVGYEDGGLLTDAIRKTPNCVLLLDELEKAHSDIYNILLQVMDYASLTDNKGRKADFRNVVIIMTSNAGAQYAGQRVGFEQGESRGQSMLKQVKRTFKPEFINRLSATVVFRDMDHKMATLILDKKLRELQQKLTMKQVTLNLTTAAHEHLLNAGFTRDYGAREMDRVIAQQLKPLLMREILFGKLKQGGDVSVDAVDGMLVIDTSSDSHA